MITSDANRIAALTRLGAWGDDTLHQLLARNAQLQGNALAVADQPNRHELCNGIATRLSFEELNRASDGMAIALLDAGLTAGDFLVVQLPNIVELVVCYYAASKLGLIVSPVPVQYGAHELRSIATTLAPRALLTCDKFKNTTLARNAADALPDLKVISCDRDIATIEELLGVDSQQRSRLQKYQLSNPVSANHIITICWTSGTTGTPKGVPRSHNMWFASALGTSTAGEYRKGDRLLAPFPLVNMAALAGFLFSSAQCGCAIILHHPFDAPVYLKQLEDEQVNFTVGPPAILNQLAKSQELWEQFDFSALRAFGSGSAPLAPWMVEKFEQDYKLQVINFYGSNEGVSLHSTPATAPNAETRATMFPRLGIAGLPWEGMRTGVVTKIADPETGHEITTPGVPGELLFAGPTVFDGYFGRDNEGVFTHDNFFRSGDLVEICGEPPLHPHYRIVGRCKDIINRGGMKISPTELDLILENYPGVMEAAVCPYPDERLGEKICACLVLLDGSEKPALSNVQQWLIERGLAKFKLPERIEVLDSLPRNPLGKVQRFALTEHLTVKT
jgi:acyl-CoA synthetase (AMP-forming)/AMP-acid ligase II